MGPSSLSLVGLVPDGAVSNRERARPRTHCASGHRQFRAVGFPAPAGPYRAGGRRGRIGAVTRPSRSPSDTAADTHTDTAAVQRRVLAVLAATQVLGGVGMATALAVSTLVATRISGSELVGGAALTCVVLGAAGAALVVSRVAARRGRRPALSLGYGVGALGAATAAVAVAAGSAAVMLAGLVLAGAATAAGLTARFAATDLAPADRRARALALVVWSTTVGAVAGPNLAGPVQALAGRLGVEPATGPFWLCAAAFALAAAGTAGGL
jgi:hypothetical protein